MVVRTSEGIFLEILEPAISSGVPIEVDVFDGANPATMLVTLDGATDKRFTRELSELGAGGFGIARTDPKATPAILAVGNLVKFKIGGVHRHAVWIEEPATTAVSTGEEGSEGFKIGGRGALAYLERAVVYPPRWPLAAAGVGASSSADNGAGATSVTVTRPAGVVAGDVMLATLAIAHDQGGVPPTGWAPVGDPESNGTDVTLSVWRHVATSADVVGKTYKWTFTGSRKAAIAVVRLTNASADVEAYALGAATGSSVNVSNPSIAVGLVNGVLLTVSAIAHTTTMTPPAGQSELVDRAGTGIAIEVASSIGPALGDTGDKVTVAALTDEWVGAQLFIPSSGVVDWTIEGGTFGEVLGSLIAAAQARGSIPFMTYDFTDEVDSHGEPWNDTHDLSFHIGTSLMEVWRHLVTLGLEGGMTPELRLQAFNDASRHFESKVIFRKGHHFVGDVIETSHSTELRTRMLTEGAGGRILEVTDPAAEVDPLIGRREGYLSVGTSDNPTTLQRAGETSLRLAAAEDDARALTVAHGLPDEGQYEPWTDYREGDWVGLDALGAGGAPEAQRVMAITLEETEAGGYTPELEFNSVEMDAFLRLQRRLDALMRDTTASGSGGATGSGSAEGASLKVAAVAGDTPGYLFDKLVTEGIVKSLVGSAGSQRVKLEATPPATNLDGLTDVDTTTVPPTNGQALLYDLASTLWKPGSVAGAGGGSLLAMASATLGADQSTSSATPAVVAAGLDMVVEVPASGELLFTMSAIYRAASGFNFYWVILEGTTNRGETTIWSSGGTAHDQYTTAQVRVTGLTPGTHTYRFAHRTNGGGTTTIVALAPVVWAAWARSAPAGAQPDTGKKYVGAVGQPAFAASWVNYALGYADCSFRRIGNVVYLEGMMKSGTIGSTAFTLPLGYRPDALASLLFPSISNSLIGRVDVQTSGAVVPFSPTSNAWVTLDAIRFTTADPWPP